MVYYKELAARIKAHYKFDQQELGGLVVVVLVTAFIFSFRDWGTDAFDLNSGLQNLVLMFFVAAISIWFRFTCQKIYGLSQGLQANFKIWWLGVALALILCFITLGRLPLILAGAMVTTFMVKLRLGEFRHGFSYWINGMVGMWGIIGNLILALIFATGLSLSPGNYFFGKGLVLNILMAWCALLPLPQLDGFSIFFGSRYIYYMGIVATALSTVLLLTKTGWGLGLAWVILILWGMGYFLISSEKR
ncbi:MAG: hypothetical protein AABX04_03460 [Nanoarchaeota archaeon]